jgi:primary-amine oxidase
MNLIRSLLFLLVSVTSAAAQTADVPHHPMDALTPSEIARVVEILGKAGVAGKSTRYPAITLREMPKAGVLVWKENAPFTRQAFVISRDGGETSESLVDLDAAKLLSHTQIPGAEPMIMDSEWARARDRFMADPRFHKALARRGYGEKNAVFCTPSSAGYFPGEIQGNRRILKVPCFDGAGRLHPTLARPIEGLMGIVDTENGEVIDVVDREVVPLPAAPPGYGKDGPKANAPSRRLEISAPAGSNIRLNGNLEVGWDQWTFHIRADKRAGVILSLAKFNDGSRDRLIAYQMNVSEMFVPYMDPNPTWGYRTFLDAGEFGLGYLISSLQPGVDCPANAIFKDLTFPNDVGATYTRPKALCIFERPTGNPAWRHYSASRRTIQGRAETELVVRHIPTLGNYDYLVDYVFAPRGSITLRVGATGFDAIKSSTSPDMEAETAAADTAYGTLIAPYTVAPNHDHFFSFRLDLDVDGPRNTFLRDTFVREILKDSPTRKSLWRLKTIPRTGEGPVDPDHMSTGGETWRLANPNEKTGLKFNPSYWIQAGHSVTSLLDASDPPQMRADFSAHELWLSKYKPDEQWAAGLYPNLSHGGDGLPQFVKEPEPLLNEDIVLWYTMGFRHAPKPEDFPVLPVLWHELTLRPAFFFDRDPSSKLNADFAPKPD